MPCTLGRDASGIVERCGAQANKFKVGDDVFGMVGGYAEKVVLDQRASPASLLALEFACRRNTLGGTDCMAGTVPACPVGGRAVSSHPRRLWWRRTRC